MTEPPTQPTPSRHRVVVIGGGFGGVRAVQGLEDSPADITLIDRTNHHLFQPLLYQVATGVLSAGQVAPALRAMFRRQLNVRVLLGRVTGIDIEKRTVTMVADKTNEIPYDTLIVATGATHSYFGHEEWERIAPGMKTLDDAGRVRSRILGAFEIAEQQSDPAERQAWLTFAVVGAGPTGVELAGQIALLAHRVLRGEYREIDPSKAQVLLFDATPSVLGAFPHSLSQHAAKDLGHLGVDVELNAPVTEIDADGLTIDFNGEHRHIPAKTVIWAAGVTASDLGKELARGSGAELDKAGRIHVAPDLTIKGHPRGVRDRGHDHAPGRTRHRPTGDPGGQVRRQGRQGPPLRRADAQAVPLPRSRDDRGDRSQQRGRRTVRPVPDQRPDRIPDLGRRAPGLPRRAGETATRP